MALRERLRPPAAPPPLLSLYCSRRSIPLRVRNARAFDEPVKAAGCRRTYRQMGRFMAETFCMVFARSDYQSSASGTARNSARNSSTSECWRCISRHYRRMGDGHDCVSQGPEIGVACATVSKAAIFTETGSIRTVGFAARLHQHVSIELQHVNRVLRSLLAMPRRFSRGRNQKVSTISRSRNDRGFSSRGPMSAGGTRWRSENRVATATG